MNKSKKVECSGKIYKINGKSFCVGEKKIKKSKKLRVKLKTKTKKLYYA
jgi:hypothetical protein